jgi:hypothetical protein
MKQIKLIILVCAFIFLIPNSKSSTEITNNGDKKTNIIIEISELGLFLNSKKINLMTDYNEIISIIGKPTKEKKQSPTEIQETKLKFGTKPNNIYIYDNYGILIYQKVGEKEINSISIDFKKQNYPFSPTKAFTGTLKINDISIDRNTSLTQLKKIKGLIINESIHKVNRAKFNNHDLTIEFNSYQDKNGLIRFSIDVNNIPEKTNDKGWTESSIKILKASVANVEKLKTLSVQYNFKISDFADCYGEKITIKLTPNEIDKPTSETQKLVLKIMQDYIMQTSKN